MYSTKPQLNLSGKNLLLAICFAEFLDAVDRSYEEQTKAEALEVAREEWVQFLSASRCAFKDSRSDLDQLASETVDLWFTTLQVWKTLDMDWYMLAKALNIVREKNAIERIEENDGTGVEITEAHSESSDCEPGTVSALPDAV